MQNMCEIHVKCVKCTYFTFLKVHAYLTCKTHVKYGYNTLMSCVDVTYFWDLWLSIRDSRCVSLFAWVS